MSEDLPVVEEVPVHFIAGGDTLYEWRCTPTDLHALAIGRLYSDGIIHDAGVASLIQIVRIGDEIELHSDKPLTQQKFMRARVPKFEIPSSDEFAEMFRALFAAVDARHASGGMHAAAFAIKGGVVFQAEDVGRHNAVDKAIGLAVLAGADVAAHGMLVSSRVSGEIARKAAHSALLWLASRSIPTTLAVRTAQMAGMPIIGRAAGKNAAVYR
jgi:FdhD protein